MDMDNMIQRQQFHIATRHLKGLCMYKTMLTGLSGNNCFVKPLYNNLSIVMFIYGHIYKCHDCKRYFDDSPQYSLIFMRPVIPLNFRYNEETLQKSK